MLGFYGADIYGKNGKRTTRLPVLESTTGDTRLTNLCRTEQYLRSASIQLLNLGCQEHCESSAHTHDIHANPLLQPAVTEMSCERHESATLVKEAPFVL